MIYFDNAATTKYKPENVYDAINYYLREVGVSPGRGSYQLGIESSRMLYKSRCKIGKYFGLSQQSRVVFTKNATEAINMFFSGFLLKGDHVIITCYEHNAVFRPLQTLKNKGIIDLSILSRNDLLLPAAEIFKKYVQKSTRLIAMTLASNLSGRIIFNEELCALFHSKGVATFIDSSQGAGKLRINMASQSIDFLAFTSHKDLLGIPGSGGLCCESNEWFSPLIQGGTGIHGDEYTNPDVFPEGYEAGTLNMPAIWALSAGLDYINAHTNIINEREEKLTSYLLKKLCALSNLVVYDAEFPRVATCCFNVRGVLSDRVITALDSKGICARGGIHCAILAHEALATVSLGAVRISLNYKNTEEEIDTLIDVLKGFGG